MEKLFIHTEYIQLNQAIKLCGWAENGAHAIELITEGLVSVNGVIELQKRKKLYPGNVKQPVVVEFEDMQLEVCAEKK